jgi:hypothetical protein
VCPSPPREKLFIAFVTFLKDLRVDVAGFRAAAFRNVTGNINEFTRLLAGWTSVGRGLHIDSIAAFVAFESGH